MEIVVLGDISEGYVYVLRTTDTHVCCTLVVSGKVVGARGAAGRGSRGFAGCVSQVAILAAYFRSVVRPVEVQVAVVVAYCKLG